MKKKITGILGLIVLLAVIIVGFSSFVVTKENEYTLVKRFGKIERVIEEAGITLKTPFIEEVDKLPKSLQFYDMTESDVITKDKKAMVADNYVLWQIEDPLIFAQSLSSNVVLAQSRINTTVYNSLKNVISSKDQSDVISGRDGELSRAIMDNIGTNMDQYGIELISVETKRLDLPADNKSAVFERMISERAQQAAAFTAEGQSEAQKIQNTTDKNIAIMISNAGKEAASIIAEGESEYMKILSEAYSVPARAEFYTFIRSLDAAKGSLVNGNKTLILPADSPMAEIFSSIE